MSQKKTKFRGLDYYEKFRCIGSNCESDCCHSWAITVDQDSAAKYRKFDEDNGTDFFRHITKKGDRNIITLKTDGYCPYFAEDKLCDMVKNYGESVLCQVCTFYPRTGRKIQHSGTTELSCVLSCPQVMRLAIMRKKKLAYLDFGSSYRKFISETAYAGTDRNAAHNQVLDAIHDAFIELGRDQDTSLNKRMAAMLLLSSQAAKLDPLHNAEDALTMLEETLLVKKSRFADIPDMAGDIGNQFKVFVQFTALFIKFKNTNQQDFVARKNLFSIINKCFAGFGLSSFAQVTDEHFAKYVHAQTNIVQPYFDANPHIWENLLSHYFLATDFPFNKNKGPLSNIIYLGVVLLFARGLLAGYALGQGRISDADFVHIFHTIFREIDHRAKQVEEINTFVAQMQANSIGQVYTILAY